MLTRQPQKKLSTDVNLGVHNNDEIWVVEHRYSRISYKMSDLKSIVNNTSGSHTVVEPLYKNQYKGKQTTN